MARSNGTLNLSKKRQSSFSNGNSSRTGKNPSGNDKRKKSNLKTDRTLEDLFEENLKDIYSAEKQLVDALPELAKAADSEDLQDAINDHLDETKRQVERLEKIFERLDIDQKEEETCLAMQGLIEESDRIIEQFDKSPVRDSALIIAAQKVEHYEIAAYGSLRELADVLGYPKIREILDRTLQEEEKADQHLSSIAQDVNDEALELSHSEEEMA